MLRLILAHPELYPLDGVVHFELEIDYPFIKDVIDHMEAECKKHSIFQGNSKYNSEYVDQNVRTKWMPIFKERMIVDNGTV